MFNIAPELQNADGQRVMDSLRIAEVFAIYYN